MLNLIMHGCNGQMGKVISGILSGDEEMEIVAGVDIYDKGTNDYPVFDDILKCDIAADIIIDFASAKAIGNLLEFALDKKIPVVLCTTGLSDTQLDRISEAAREIPILKSANMSLGINTLVKLLKSATEILSGAGFDIEIIEKHHNRKLDAPSGTALLLADSINEVLDNEFEYKFDRSKDYKKREKKEIGISAVRGGTIVGEHEIIFAGLDEVIEIKHTAYSRAVFANGAIQAAKFLAGKKAGMYTIGDVIKNKESR